MSEMNVTRRNFLSGAALVSAAIAGAGLAGCAPQSAAPAASSSSAGETLGTTGAANSTVGFDTHVGPFAYIRPGSSVGNHVKVGDFVEIKNSVVDDGTKISHLTYVGDSDVGKNVNFGCGTVTVNYDRAKKYRTTIGDNAFIGCNTNLVAPVTVGEGAYTAAGSTITDDIPAMALAIARARQTNKKDWAAKHKLKESK